MRGPPRFDYAEAFSRNIGWVTEWEQQTLRSKRVAIAGMGGVGGNHLLTLTRLGIGAFNIADLDVFEPANFNRQAGAARSTLGHPKVAVLAQQARDINPELDIRMFPDGVRLADIDAFLEGVDLFVDGLDFFVIDVRAELFARCRERGIPAITAAPIGMGTAYVIFSPQGMPFEDYFRLDGLSPVKQQVNFLLGVNPAGLHRPYLVDPYRVDLEGKRGPSTAMGCQLCAGVVGSEATKILLGRGQVRAAPWYHHFDAYRGRLAAGRLRWGNRGPLQSLKRHLGYRAYARLAREAWPVETAPTGGEIERILDLARWAPSGDNTQPWRFRVAGDETLEVEIAARETAGNVYEYNDGQPTLLAAGFLLETIRIAATRFGRAAAWQHESPDGMKQRIGIALRPDPEIRESPLCPYIPVRSVDRRPYRTAPLGAASKAALDAALGDGLAIRWFETLEDRWRMARLNALATDIRLRIPEAYAVHRRVLDWHRRFSPDGVPVRAVGLDAGTLSLMRTLMTSWRRMDLVNRYAAGTVLPRIELDLLPGLLCAAHFAVSWKEPHAPAGRAAALLCAGMRLQRFWLTATRLGLAVQPALATLCFAQYGRDGTPFTDDIAVRRRAGRLAARLADTAPMPADRVIFLGRIGWPRRPIAARSVRRAASELVLE